MLAATAFNFKRMMNKCKKKFFHFFQMPFSQFYMLLFYVIFYPFLGKKLKGAY